MAKNKVFEYRLPCEFGQVGPTKRRVAIGFELAWPVSSKVGKGETKLQKGDLWKLFEQKHLDVRLECDPNDSNDSKGQAKLIENDGLEHDLIGDVLGFTVRRGSVKCRLSLARGEIDLNTLDRYAGRSGYISITVKGDAESHVGRPPSEDDESGDNVDADEIPD